MKLSAPEKHRRSGSDFKGSDARPVNCQRKEDVRITQRVVIEEILDARVEVIRINSPSAQRNRETKLILLVALAAQRNEIEALADCQRQQRSRDSREWRRLIIAPIKTVQHPVQAGNPNRRPQARAGRAFIKPAMKARKAHAARQS